MNGGLLVDILPELAGTNARLGATAVLIAVVLLLYFGTVPVVQRFVSAVRGRLYDEYVTEYVDDPPEAIDLPFPTQTATWGFRGLLLFAAGLVGLTIWGFDSVVDSIVVGIQSWFPTLFQLALSILLLTAAYILTRVLRRRLYAYTGQIDHVSKHQESVVYRVTQVSVYIAASLVVLSVWDVNLEGLLIGAGFLGIVVGMAARQTLGSLLAGFVLMFSRPFEIGDWVQIGDHEGIVTDISIINTRLRSFDDETIVLPNDVAGNETIENMTDSERLRLRVRVGVSYDTDLDRARELILQAVDEVDEVLSIPKPTVVLTQFGDSSIGFEVRFWIEPPTAPRRAKSQTAVIKSIKDTFDEAGVEIPFPQRDLSGGIDTAQVETERRSVEIEPDPED